MVNYGPYVRSSFIMLPASLEVVVVIGHRVSNMRLNGVVSFVVVDTVLGHPNFAGFQGK